MVAVSRFQSEGTLLKGVKFDRDALYEYLWQEAQKTRQHLTEVYQTGLAEEFEITKATLNIAMMELIADGKIKKIKAKQGNIGTYFVREPDA